MLQCIIVFVPIPLFGFWFWMFRDMMNNPYLTNQERHDWLIRFAFLTILGAYWYYQVEYKNRNL